MPTQTNIYVEGFPSMLLQENDESARLCNQAQIKVASINTDPSFQQEEYQVAIETLRAFHPQLKQIIHNADVNRLQRESYRHLTAYPSDLFREIRDLFYYALFFPDAETLQFFQDLGFSEKDLNLFIPLDKLAQVMDAIAAQSPFCRKQIAWEWIRFYLRMRISTTVQKWTGYVVPYNGENKSIFYKQLRAFFQRRNGRKNNPFAKVSKQDSWIEQRYFQPVNAVYQNEEKTRKYLMGAASGKLDNAWFKRISDACFPGKKTNQNWRALFDLYKLIANDHTLFSEQERLSVPNAYETTSDVCYRAKRAKELSRCTSSVFESN